MWEENYFVKIKTCEGLQYISEVCCWFSLQDKNAHEHLLERKWGKSAFSNLKLKPPTKHSQSHWKRNHSEMAAYNIHVSFHLPVVKFTQMFWLALWRLFILSMTITSIKLYIFLPILVSKGWTVITAFLQTLYHCFKIHVQILKCFPCLSSVQQAMSETLTLAFSLRLP